MHSGSTVRDCEVHKTVREEQNKFLMTQEEWEKKQRDWEEATRLWKESGRDLSRIPIVAYDYYGRRMA